MKVIKLTKRLTFFAASILSVFLILVAPILPGFVDLIVVLPCIVLLPGLLLWIRFFHGKQHSDLGYSVLFSLALGILAIISEGLILNWLLPVFNIKAPLQYRYIVSIYIIIYFGILSTYFIGSGKKIGRSLFRGLHTQNSRSISSYSLNVLPLVIPLLAIAGAFRLNNGATNGVALIDLIFMVAAMIVMLLKPKIFNPKWLLFNLGLGLLLSTSLRSWYISGFDISQEFQVFTTTLKDHYWNVNGMPGNTYNACLSLTIFPTILQQLTHLNPEYIFKFGFQAIFACTAPIVYMISRLYTGRRLSFLASVFYIGQAQFIDSMPGIVRQEVSLFFFGLLILLLLAKTQPDRNYKSLVLWTGLGMTISHYSTTYIAIAIIGIGSIALAFINKLTIKKSDDIDRNKNLFLPQFGLKITVYLVLISLAWYAQVNPAGQGFVTTIRSSITNIGDTFRFNQSSGQVQTLLLGAPARSNNQSVETYQQSFHSSEITLQPITTLPLVINNKPLFQFTNVYRSISLFVIKILLPASPFVLIFWRKTRKEFMDLIGLSVGGLAVVGLVVALPVLSQHYNIERVYQQVLILLAIPTLYFIYIVIPTAKRLLRYFIVGAFTILYFMTSPGTALINQIAGGINPPINLNNSGSEYSEFYTHASDVNAATWVGKECDRSPPYGDYYSSLRLNAYGSIPYGNINGNILEIGHDSCLLLGYTNTTRSIYYTIYQNQVVTYTVNKNYYPQRYDNVYSNGQSRVYRN